MKSYSPEVFDKLILFVKGDEQAGKWLRDEGYRELAEFWDAVERVEKSFQWLMENQNRALAATVDALSGNDQAKRWLISSGQRELAAFVDACFGSQSAVTWLLQAGQQGWVRVAKEIYQRDKKKSKSIWSLFDFGNPFR